MKTTIFVSRKQLIASSFTMSDKDIRTYLNGVLVEATKTETRLVSTDGSVMSIQKYIADNEGIENLICIIIPNDIVLRIKKSIYDKIELILENETKIFDIL